MNILYIIIPDITIFEGDCKICDGDCRTSDGDCQPREGDCEKTTALTDLRCRAYNRSGIKPIIIRRAP